MDLILLAGGRSRRMGDGVEKQLARIGGKPALIHCIEVIREAVSLERIIVNATPEARATVSRVIEDYGIANVVLCDAGETRQESVAIALEFVTAERVLLHEAARPLITAELVRRVAASPAAAVVPVWEVPFTVTIGSVRMEAELDRSKLRNVQLPQAFNTEVLKESHLRAATQGEVATEDSALVFRAGYEVVFVDGIAENIKITYPVDLRIAEAIIYG